MKFLAKSFKRKTEAPSTQMQTESVGSQPQGDLFKKIGAFSKFSLQVVKLEVKDSCSVIPSIKYSQSFDLHKLTSISRLLTKSAPWVSKENKSLKP